MNLFTRISSRSLRRSPARSAAMLALVVVPVAATTVGLSLIAGGIHGGEIAEDHQFGRTHLNIAEKADLRAVRTVEEVAAAEGLVAVPAVRIIEGSVLIGAETVSYIEADLGDPLLDNFVELRSGRLPRQAGEAVVTIGSGDATSQALSRKIREAGGFTEPHQPVRIVGVVKNLARPNAVIAHPGTIPQAFGTASNSFGPTRVQTLFALRGGIAEAQRIASERYSGQIISMPTTVVATTGLPRGTPNGEQSVPTVNGASTATSLPPQQQNSSHAAYQPRISSRSRNAWYFIPVVLASSLIAWTSMVIASGLSIGAARRRRELGILAVNGADASTLRRAVRADGLVLGVVGSTAGVLLAVPILLLLDHLLVKADALTTVRAGASLWLLAGPLIGVATTVRAASRASNGVACQAVGDLLASRSSENYGLPAGKLGRFTAVTLIVLSVVALGTFARSGWARPDGGDAGARAFFLFVMLLVAAKLIGVLPSRAIQHLPQILSRAGLTLRLAARDLQRFGSRTAGATSAIAVTLAVVTAAAAATAPPGLGRPELPISTVGSGPGPQPLVLRIGGLGFQEVDGSAVSRPLTAAQIAKVQTAVGKRATVEVLTVAQSYVGSTTNSEEQILACADNAAELSPAGSTLANGCLEVTPVLIETDQIAELPPSFAEPLRANQPVAWSSIQYTGTPVNARLQFRGTSVPLTVPEATTVGVMNNPLPNATLGYPLISIGVPPGVWETFGLASIGRPVVAVSKPAATEEEASAIYQAVSESIGMTDQNQGNFSYSYGGRSISRTGVPRPGISGWVALGVTLLILMVLAVSLGLVRVETQGEEQTLLSQGATSRQRAGVVAWRAALTVAVAATAAVCVVTPISAVATIGSGLQLPQWYWVLGMIVGLPALAYGLFFAAGLRRLPQTSSI